MRATGVRWRANSRYDIRDMVPISMFCGLPVIVATLPMLEPVATPRSSGTGERLVKRAASMTIGANTRQMVSLTKSADRMPAANTTATSSADG